MSVNCSKFLGPGLRLVDAGVISKFVEASNGILLGDRSSWSADSALSLAACESNLHAFLKPARPLDSSSPSPDNSSRASSIGGDKIDTRRWPDGADRKVFGRSLLTESDEQSSSTPLGRLEAVDSDSNYVSYRPTELRISSLHLLLRGPGLIEFERCSEEPSGLRGFLAKKGPIGWASVDLMRLLARLGRLLEPRLVLLRICKLFICLTTSLQFVMSISVISFAT